MSNFEVTVALVGTTFHAPLLQFVRRRVADEASAEDSVQDVFLADQNLSQSY